jgi:ParB-like chromosome segregation protein Spo0J
MMNKTIPITKIQTNNGQIAGLPKNPRFIRDERFAKLKQSIEDLPSMLELRELIVIPQNGHFVTIGGNMRLRAAKDLGFKELPRELLCRDT